MTVAELIEELKQLDPELIVLREDNIGGFESISYAMEESCRGVESDEDFIAVVLGG